MKSLLVRFSHILLLVLLMGLAARIHAEEIPESWLSSVAVPTGVATEEAQRFLQARVPALDVPGTRADWETQAQDLRKNLLERVYLENVPEAWLDAPVVVWGERIEHDGYTIRLLRYEAVPGLWIPAALYVPHTGARAVPAVLNVNGHSYDMGKADEVEQIRCATLARNGVLTLHPEWFACGELAGPEYSHSNLAYLDVVGVRGVSLFYLAMKKALDVLLAQPQADPARVAMSGLSGGGWQTAVLSALDERIALTVPVAGHGGMRPRIEALYDLGDLEQAPSGLLTVADYAHLTALFAPRPALLIYNARDNCCFLPERALPTTYEAALPVYRLLGAEQNLAFHINHDPGTHNYERDNREQFYAFLGAHFLGDHDTIKERPLEPEEIHAKEELYAGLPDNNATFASLAEAVFADHAPRTPPVEETGNRRTMWQSQYVASLGAIVAPQAITWQTEVRQARGADGLQSDRYTLKSADWTLGALHVLPDRADTAEVTIVLSDQGIALESERLDRLVGEGRPVLACDPLFFGANTPNPRNPSALAMVFDATANRLLGVQVGQIAALCAWAKSTLHAERITLDCVGWNATVASLMACALANSKGSAIEHVTLEDTPHHLSELITQRVKYTGKPALFCYSLVKHFDLPQLIAGCGATRVEIMGEVPE